MVFIIWVANAYIKQPIKDLEIIKVATATITEENGVVFSIKNRSSDFNLLILAIVPALLILIMAYLCLTTLWRMNYMFQTDVLRIRGIFQVASIKAPQAPVCFISYGTKSGVAVNSSDNNGDNNSDNNWNSDEIVSRLPKGFTKFRYRAGFSTPFRDRNATGAVPAGSGGSDGSGRRGGSGSAQRRRNSTLSRTRAYHR